MAAVQSPKRGPEFGGLKLAGEGLLAIDCLGVYLPEAIFPKKRAIIQQKESISSRSSFLIGIKIKKYPV